MALWATQYTLGVIDAPKVARKALLGFRGRAESWLEESCAEWFPKYVLPEVQQAGRRAVKQHREAGDFVAIVTRRDALRGRTGRSGAGHRARDLLGARARRRRSLHRGRSWSRFATAWARSSALQKSPSAKALASKMPPFYSDSITDLPLLEVVKAPVVINPDRRLRKIAKKRGWPIEAW